MFPSLRSVENDSRCADFASLVRLMLVAKGQTSAARFLAETGDYSERVRDIVDKAAAGSVGGLGTSPPGWGGDLSSYELVAGAFSATLRNVGSFDAVLAVANRVPLKSRVVVSVSTVVGDEVSEGAPKPVHELALSGSDLPIGKYSCIVVITEELLSLSNGRAESLISTELRNGVTAAVDNDFVDSLVSQTSPIGSTGAPLSDIGALLAAIESGSNASFVVIASPSITKSIATTSGLGGGPAFANFTATGGTISGVRILANDHIAAGVMLGVDASGLAMGATELVLSQADQAALQLTTDGPLVSLWQANLRALRVERMCSWHVLRAASIASISGVDYGASP